MNNTFICLSQKLVFEVLLFHQAHLVTCLGQQIDTLCVGGMIAQAPECSNGSVAILAQAPECSNFVFSRPEASVNTSSGLARRARAGQVVLLGWS